MTMHKTDDMSRKEEGRGLARIEDCLDTLMQVVENYIKYSKEGLITAASNTVGYKTKQKTNKQKKQANQETEIGR